MVAFSPKYESIDNTKAKTDERLCRQAQFLFFFHEYSPSYAIPSLTVHTYVTTMLFHSTFYFKSAYLLNNLLYIYSLPQISPNVQGRRYLIQVNFPIHLQNMPSVNSSGCPAFRKCIFAMFCN